MDLNPLQMETRSLDTSTNRNEGVPHEISPVLQQFAHVSAIVVLLPTRRREHKVVRPRSVGCLILSLKKIVIDLLLSDMLSIGVTGPSMSQFLLLC